MNFDKLIILVDRFYKIAAKKSPEAPIWAPFGEYAWAVHREGMPEEPDNEAEKEVYKQIKKHFASTNREGLPLITNGLLSAFMELGWYEPVLHPPPAEKLYRGLKITSKDDLITLLNKENIDDNGAIDYDENYNIPIQNGHSTSWSFKKSITKDFSTNYGKSKRGWVVTIIALVKDNPNKFLAGPGGLYDVEGLSMWHKEKETVGLEPIKIKRIEWYKLGDK